MSKWLTLKCGYIQLMYDKNELNGFKKELKSFGRLNIDQVWEIFLKNRSEVLRLMLIDHYMRIVEYILSKIQTIIDPEKDEYTNIYSTGMNGVSDAIDAFKKGGDEEFKSYFIPRLRQEMFKPVTNNNLKRRFGDNGEKITDLCLRSLPLGKPNKKKDSCAIILVVDARIMRNWLCRKCKALEQHSKRPDTSNCPAGGRHQWTDLGKVGTIRHQCEKCRIEVMVEKRPLSLNCPEGGSHKWTVD